LRRRCDLRRRNGKPNPLFALQLRCITGHFSLVFSLYFPLFLPILFELSCLCSSQLKPPFLSFLRFSRILALLVLAVVVLLLVLLLLLLLLLCLKFL
jgi:hypothetical protein